MIPLAIALLAIAPVTTSIQVDFRLGKPVVGAPDPLAGHPIPLAPADPQTDAVAAPDQTDQSAAPTPSVLHPHFFTAHGFGRDVPLSFAVRQVVPARVRVTYGRGVDPKRSVSWTGGKPWDEVLRAAVVPLGYHVIMSHMAAEIVE